MRKLLFTFLMLAALATLPFYPLAQAKDDDFGAVVKVIEQFYHVKHKSIPFLARAGLKTATTVARLAGGTKRQLAEAGSVKVAYFEDQDFDSRGGFSRFRTSMEGVLARDWSPLIQVVSGPESEQTYVFLRPSGEKFHVLVVNIGRREGSVVQVTLSPQTLAKLMKSPDDMGNSITVEATTTDE
ncbi:MAG TPA: hypothetical protein VGW36_08225 [Pyrinomonadaceae bacterium]|nr:hypothetical protein [Pyrinomonadaceae bacterium]